MEKKILNIAIVQARMNSSRLRGKVLKKIGPLTCIELLLKRLSKSKLINKIIVATSTNPQDNILYNQLSEMGVECFRGEEQNVLKRFVDLLRNTNATNIIRITGDCPFIDGKTLDHCIEQIGDFQKFDLCTTKGQFPVGIDFELINCKTLKDNWKYMNKEDKEHLTYYFYREENKKKFRILNFTMPNDWQKSDISFTIDTLEDYLRALKILNNFGTTKFSVKDLLNINS